MLSASESVKSIVRDLNSAVKDLKTMQANQGQEAALSTNKPWVLASGTKIKRDSPDGTPLDKEIPETFFSLSERTMHAIAQVTRVRRMRMLGEATASDEWKVKRKGVLSEVDVSPLEIAFLFDYATEKSVREMRIRHGLDQNTGRPLRSDQRPLTNRKKK